MCDIIIIHTYIHTHIHTYIHTYIHTFYLFKNWCQEEVIDRLLRPCIVAIVTRERRIGGRHYISLGVNVTSSYSGLLATYTGNPLVTYVTPLICVLVVLTGVFMLRASAHNATCYCLKLSVWTVQLVGYVFVLAIVVELYKNLLLHYQTT